MRTFNFEIKIKIGEGKAGFLCDRAIKSNHLQGAIRKLYQQEKRPFELKKILNVW